GTDLVRGQTVAAARQWDEEGAFDAAHPDLVPARGQSPDGVRVRCGVVRRDEEGCVRTMLLEESERVVLVLEIVAEPDAQRDVPGAAARLDDVAPQQFARLGDTDACRRH